MLETLQNAPFTSATVVFPMRSEERTVPRISMSFWVPIGPIECGRSSFPSISQIAVQLNIQLSRAVRRLTPNLRYHASATNVMQSNDYGNCHNGGRHGSYYERHRSDPDSPEICHKFHTDRVPLRTCPPVTVPRSPRIWTFPASLWHPTDHSDRRKYVNGRKTTAPVRYRNRVGFPNNGKHSGKTYSVVVSPQSWFDT